MGKFLARNKSVKINNNNKKRGRPPIEGQVREPNGRISRSKKSFYKIALERRAKRYGLTIEQAADQKSETYLGRLTLIGKEKGFSQEQYEASQLFLEIRNDYKKSLLSPDAYYENHGYNMKARDPEAYDRWVKIIKKKYARTMRAIEEAQFNNQECNLYAALQYIVIEDLQLPHLIAPTRILLNALHRHFFPEYYKTPEKNSNITLAGKTR